MQIHRLSAFSEILLLSNKVLDEIHIKHIAVLKTRAGGELLQQKWKSNLPSDFSPLDVTNLQVKRNVVQDDKLPHNYNHTQH